MDDKKKCGGGIVCSRECMNVCDALGIINKQNGGLKGVGMIPLQPIPGDMGVSI